MHYLPQSLTLNCACLLEDACGVSGAQGELSITSEPQHHPESWSSRIWCRISDSEQGSSQYCIPVKAADLQVSLEKLL